VTDAVPDEWEPLNRKEDFTTFGPESEPSVLEAAFSQLFRRVRDEETAIVYLPQFREFGLPVLDGGCSIVAIEWCPFSGKRLPESLRERRFEVLEAEGLVKSSTGLPDEFKSEAWWVKRGLAS
jgi:hypothetical protein